MMKLKYVLLSFLFFLFACTSKIDSSTYSEKQKLGNEIAAKAQAELLKNVGGAIQKGGTEYAVEFCNLKASSIIEDLNQEFDCTITRVSDKNRNSNATLSSNNEQEVWNEFQTGIVKDTIIQADKNLVFYKPIKIALPACLKCHGQPETDIDRITQQKINELYPKDLATGYALNDFRGLWKIEFELE